MKENYSKLLVFLPASASYELPMFVVMFRPSFDQIFHELWKGRVWISFSPFPPSCDTDVSAVFSNEALLYSGARLELVPAGGDTTEVEEVVIVGIVLNVGNEKPGSCKE